MEVVMATAVRIFVKRIEADIVDWLLSRRRNRSRRAEPDRRAGAALRRRGNSGRRAAMLNVQRFDQSRFAQAAARASSSSRSRALRVERGGALELGARLVAAARASRAGRRARSAAGGSPRARARRAARRRSRARPRARTPSPTATARLSSTTGDGVELRRARRRARRCAPSRSPPAVRARAWQAAIAACSAYGPGAPPSASARSSAASPRRISSWSQRARSWSSSRIGSPVGPRARRERDAWISISATRPCTSGSSRRQLGEDAAEAQRVLAERRAHPVVAGGRRVALVEDRGR